MRRNLRYLILLLILLAVAVSELLDKTRTTSWEHPLWVRVYAVNGDGRAATDRYIEQLDSNDFDTIETFVNRRLTDRNKLSGRGRIALKSFPVF